MTQENIENVGDVSSSQQDVSQGNNNVPNVEAQQPPKERYIPESRVNEIIVERTKEANKNAYERARRELEQQQKSQETSSNHSMGGMQQASEDHIRQMMRDEYQKLQQQQQEEFKRQNFQQQVTNLANEFMGKIAAAKDAYPDLEKRVDEIGDLDQLIYYINETDAVPGLVEHLLSPGNGHKVASLFTLAEKSPARLRAELKHMADSIKNNESARNRPHINDPLRQPTYSANTLDSGSTSSIEALKNEDWTRG